MPSTLLTPTPGLHNSSHGLQHMVTFGQTTANLAATLVTVQDEVGHPETRQRKVVLPPKAITSATVPGDSEARGSIILHWLVGPRNVMFRPTGPQIGDHAHLPREESGTTTLRSMPLPGATSHPLKTICTI